MTPQRRVVVTGFGALSPIGLDNDSIWSSLAAQRGGIDFLKAFETPAGFPSLAAEVHGFDARKYVPKENRKVTKVMARDIQLAVGAAKVALDHSGVIGHVDPARFAVNSGAALIATEHSELSEAIHESLDRAKKFDIKRWGGPGMDKLFPLWMLKYLPNMPACHISILHDAQGPNNSITCGEASAMLAVGEAFRVMQRRGADVFLAGGSDTKIHPLSLVRMGLLGRLSARRDEPQSACRPFDEKRDGTVAGEGCGFVVLEEYSHAEKRGAEIYAELLGFGSSWNRVDRADAVVRAMKCALEDAGLSASDLGFVLAHGQGGVEDDRVEQQALSTLLSDAPNTSVVALKGYWGYQGSASGMMEVISALLASRKGTMPGSLNLDRPDPGSAPVQFAREPFAFPQRPFAAYAFGFGGQCGAIVLRPTLA